MEWFLIGIIIVLLGFFYIRQQKTNTPADAQQETPAEEASGSVQDYKATYQPKWMFTYNEKDMYYKLNSFAQQHDLTVFAKVRLFDLIEPRDKKDKSARFRIQAKHVDFVLCSNKLVAKYVIELDDQSHESTDRKNRDAFVDEVLMACGYKVLHIRTFDETALLELIGAKPEEINAP